MRHEIYDSTGLIYVGELPDPPRSPLDAHGVAATLNAVLGMWPLDDAANAVGLAPEQLVAEAEAWAVAQEVNG